MILYRHLYDSLARRPPILMGGSSLTEEVTKIDLKINPKIDRAIMVEIFYLTAHFTLIFEKILLFTST